MEQNMPPRRQDSAEKRAMMQMIKATNEFGELDERLQRFSVNAPQINAAAAIETADTLANHLRAPARVKGKTKPRRDRPGEFPHSHVNRAYGSIGWTEGHVVPKQDVWPRPFKANSIEKIGDLQRDGRNPWHQFHDPSLNLAGPQVDIDQLNVPAAPAIGHLHHSRAGERALINAPRYLEGRMMYPSARQDAMNSVLDYVLTSAAPDDKEGLHGMGFQKRAARRKS